jgi:hypothetical protein
MVLNNLIFQTMTYKELLQTLADKSSANYKDYLQSKIDILLRPEDELLTDKVQQYKDASTHYEKKFSAVLAMARNEEELDRTVPEEEINAALK